MKIAMLGGSFNPPHIAHLILADSVCTELGYDKVLFVPVNKPSHKTLSGAASAADRLAMTQALVAGDERFVCEPCEIERGGISYTYDTVRYLQQKYADVLTAKIGVVLGNDLAADYGKWEHAADLAACADLILACRPEEYANADFCNAPTEKYAVADESADISHFPHLTLANPQIVLSSTDIRERIACGASWRYLVSDGVFRYIKAHTLYGSRTVRAD